MDFCFLPICGVILLAPMRRQLRWKDVLPAEEAPRQAVVFYTVLFLLSAAAAYEFPDEEILRALFKCSIPLQIASCMCYFGRASGDAWFLPYVGWCMLIVIQGVRILYAEPRPGAEAHLLDLFIWAFVVEHLPLRGQAWLGTWFASWWCLWAPACILLIHPGAGNEHQHPSESLLYRLRFYSLEAILALAFTVIPAREGTSTVCFVPEAVRKHLAWLNRWAIFAYCSHVAVERAFPSHHWFLAVTLVCGSSFLFWLHFYLFGIHEEDGYGEKQPLKNNNLTESAIR